MNKLIFLLIAIFIAGCSSGSRFRTGQKVTNGYCDGYIVQKNSGFAEIRPWNCIQKEYPYAFVDYDELRAAE